MASPPQQDYEVSVKPAWLYASIEEKPGHRIITVFRSVRTRDAAPWMQPVWWQLRTNCNFPEGKRRRIPAPDMMGGEAWVYSHVLFAVCPGEGVPHECSLISQGEETPFGGFPAIIPVPV